LAHSAIPPPISATTPWARPSCVSDLQKAAGGKTTTKRQGQLYALHIKNIKKTHAQFLPENGWEKSEKYLTG